MGGRARGRRSHAGRGGDLARRARGGQSGPVPLGPAPTREAHPSPVHARAPRDDRPCAAPQRGRAAGADRGGRRRHGRAGRVPSSAGPLGARRRVPRRRDPRARRSRSGDRTHRDTAGRGGRHGVRQLHPAARRGRFRGADAGGREGGASRAVPRPRLVHRAGPGRGRLHPAARRAAGRAARPGAVHPDGIRYLEERLQPADPDPPQLAEPETAPAGEAAEAIPVPPSPSPAALERALADDLPLTRSCGVVLRALARSTRSARSCRRCCSSGARPTTC